GYALVAGLRDPGRAEIAPARMRGDRHVARAPRDRMVDDSGVERRKFFRIVAPRTRLLALLGGAQIRPYRVVELEIPAARGREGAHRLAVRLGKIVEELRDVRIDFLADAVPAAAEMQRARARDGHLRLRAGVTLQKLEMLEHRVSGEPHLADDPDRLRLGLDAVELQAVLGHEAFDAVEMLQKIEMPPRPAIFAVGREFQPDLLLFAHDLLDLAILDLAQGGRGHLAALAFGSRLFERRGAQQAADVVGAVERLRSRHGFVLSSAISMRSLRPRLRLAG